MTLQIKHPINSEQWFHNRLLNKLGYHALAYETAVIFAGDKAFNGEVEANGTAYGTIPHSQSALLIHIKKN